MGGFEKKVFTIPEKCIFETLNERTGRSLTVFTERYIPDLLPRQKGEFLPYPPKGFPACILSTTKCPPSQLPTSDSSVDLPVASEPTNATTAPPAWGIMFFFDRAKRR